MIFECDDVKYEKYLVLIFKLLYLQIQPESYKSFRKREWDILFKTKFISIELINMLVATFKFFKNFVKVFYISIGFLI